MNPTRRNFLGGVAAASVVPASGIALASSVNPASALSEESTKTAAPPVNDKQENPDLVRAYDDVVAARAELQDAKDALEWLADEWRHLWPLAPEEILGCVNADHFSGTGHSNPERNIIGNYLRRDTSVLLKRFNREMQERMPVTCFDILTPDEAQDTIDLWTSRVPTGRTEKALERNRADRDQTIRKYQHKLSLAREYQAETDRLRKAAGVDKVKQRVADAEKAVAAAVDRVSRIPALTHYGLRIKACAIGNDEHFEHFLRCSGPLGEMARLVDAILDIGGRASA